MDTITEYCCHKWYSTFSRSPFECHHGILLPLICGVQSLYSTRLWLECHLGTAVIIMRYSISLFDSSLAQMSLGILLSSICSIQSFYLARLYGLKCHLGYCCHLYAVFEYLTGFGFSGSIDILDTTAVIVRYSISLLGSASLAQMAYQNIAAIGVRYKISLLDSVFLTRRLPRNATATIMQ